VEKQEKLLTKEDPTNHIYCIYIILAISSFYHLFFFTYSTPLVNSKYTLRLLITRGSMRQPNIKRSGESGSNIMKHATKMAPAKEIYFGILPASPLVQKSLGDPYHMLVRVQVELKLTSYGRVSQSMSG
jgi:hypothetical protein